MPQRKKSRETILEEAGKLFYKHGYKATGVDAIAKAAGVTKATLYHHFENKDALIEEVLNYLSEYHRQGYIEVWNKKGLKPLERLTVLLDEIESFFKEEDCYGCPFINAAGEYTERDNPARKICEEHYQFLVNNLEQFARDAKLKKPRLLAEQIALIIAGSYTMWFVGNIKDAAIQGKLIAEMIVDRHKKVKLPYL